MLISQVCDGIFYAHWWCTAATERGCKKQFAEMHDLLLKSKAVAAVVSKKKHISAVASVYVGWHFKDIVKAGLGHFPKIVYICW